jgi:hypothetical protein
MAPTTRRSARIQSIKPKPKSPKAKKPVRAAWGRGQPAKTISKETTWNPKHGLPFRKWYVSTAKTNPRRERTVSIRCKDKEECAAWKAAYKGKSTYMKKKVTNYGYKNLDAKRAYNKKFIPAYRKARSGALGRQNMIDAGAYKARRAKAVKRKPAAPTFAQVVRRTARIGKPVQRLGF